MYSRGFTLIEKLAETQMLDSMELLELLAMLEAERMTEGRGISYDNPFSPANRSICMTVVREHTQIYAI